MGCLPATVDDGYHPAAAYQEPLTINKDVQLWFSS